MKIVALVTSACIGLFLGTTIAVASASTPTATPATPVPPVEVTPPSVELGTSSESRVITIPVVEIRGSRPKPAGKAKTWTCGEWQDSNVGGRYKACDWK